MPHRLYLRLDGYRASVSRRGTRRNRWPSSCRAVGRAAFIASPRRIKLRRRWQGIPGSFLARGATRRDTSARAASFRPPPEAGKAGTGRTVEHPCSRKLPRAGGFALQAGMARLPRENDGLDAVEVKGVLFGRVRSRLSFSAVSRRASRPRCIGCCHRFLEIWLASFSLAQMTSSGQCGGFALGEPSEGVVRVLGCSTPEREIGEGAEAAGIVRLGGDGGFVERLSRLHMPHGVVADGQGQRAARRGKPRLPPPSRWLRLSLSGPSPRNNPRGRSRIPQRPA